MLDIHYIRENYEKLKQNIINRGLDPKVSDVDLLLELDKERGKLILQIEKFRAKRNELSEEIARVSGVRKDELVSESKVLKKDLTQLEAKLNLVQQEWQSLMDLMPNITHSQMPVGKDENDNVERKSWGERKKFDFSPKDHLELGESLDLIDVKKSSEVAGSRFYYLKNEAVLMQWGIFDLTFKMLIQKGFIPIISPVLLKYKPLYGTGYFPSEEDQIYALKADPRKVESEKELFLAGTSEQAIVAYHMNDVFEQEKLPKKYVGISTCFRSEAGSWGRDVRGIKRVHQFDKIEMVYFTTPESSQKCMQEALGIEEEILQILALPYRVVEMCTGNVSLATYRKFDIEAWLPSQQDFMETHSNSDLAAYHARRLDIKYRRGGTTEFVHTISATAITNTRPIVAILDNFQQEDGSVEIPEALQEYVGKKVLSSRA